MNNWENVLDKMKQMLDINGSLFDNSDVFYVDCSQLVLDAKSIYGKKKEGDCCG